MKILFTSGSLYSHVNTLLPLAMAAQRAGHEVAFATGADFAGHVERTGLTCWPVGLTHAQAGGNHQVSWLDYFARTARHRLAELMPRALEWKPDMVVHEDTELAGAVVAAVCRARHVVHGLGMMPPPHIATMIEVALSQLAIRSGLGEVAPWLRDALYVEVCPPALRSTGERFWGRAQSLRPSAGVALPSDSLPERMAELPYQRTVALTLGTVYSEAQEVMACALDGLCTLAVNVVVLAGPHADLSHFGAQPPQVLIERYVPYALVLPRCDALVSQGGAGGMFSALSHGLPQLLIPLGADQFTNARACELAGAGLVLESKGLSAQSVTSSMARLLEEPQFARAAAALRGQIDSMPDASAVLKIIAEGTTASVAL